MLSLPQSTNSRPPQALTSLSWLNSAVIVSLPWALLTSRTLADLCVVMLGLCFLIRTARQQQWQSLQIIWPKAAWLKAAAVFFLYLACINSPLSLAPADSLLHSLYFCRWPLYAVALAAMLDNTDKRRLFCGSMLVACCALMLDCVWQYVHGSDVLGQATIGIRLTGPYHAPLPGIMLVRVLFVASAFLMLKPIKHTLVWQALLYISALTVLLMTGERMAMLLALLGMLCVYACDGYAVWHQDKHQPHQRRRLLWMLLAISVILLLLGIWITHQPQISERMGHELLHKLSDFGNSDYGHVFAAAIAAWKQQPWLGHGLHQYASVCNSMGLLAQWGMFCSHPHNLYLLLAAETGAIGVLLFAGMLLLLYRQVVQACIVAGNWRLLGHALAILSVCFFPLIGGISLWSNWVAALAWTGVGVCLSLTQAKS